MVFKLRHPDHYEHGSFLLFFAAAILPFLLVFSSLGLIIVKLNKEQRALQETLDRAAIAAAKKLPFTEAAYDAAHFLLTESGIPASHLANAIEVSPARVRITYDMQLPTLLKAIAPHTLAAVRLAARTETAINAKDIIIFLDASSYMGPVPTDSTDTTWNNTGPGGAWPVAEYFRRLQSSSNPITVDGVRPHPRALTQQCFNPAFSAFKEASIRLYDYFSKNPDNSVGVLIGPGSTQNVTVIRNLIPPEARNTSPGEGRFDFYRSITARDEFCLAAAKNEQHHAGYRVPLRGDPYYWGAPGEVHFPDAPSSVIAMHEHSLRTEMLQTISVRDILWSTAVRRSYVGGSATQKIVNFNTVLRKVSNLLLAAPFRAERAGMNHKTSRMGILMLGDIPWVQGQRLTAPDPASTSTPPLHQVSSFVRGAIKAQLSQIEARAKAAGIKIQLYISITKHPGMYPAEQYPGCVAQDDEGRPAACNTFGSDTAVLGNILKNNGTGSSTVNNYTEGTHLQIQLLRSPDTEALAKSIPAWLPLIDRSVLKLK